MVSRGTLHTLSEHPALIAERKAEPVGFAVYRVESDAWEVLAILAEDQWQGIGSILMDELERLALSRSVTRLWLCTTNDNLSALRFYQRRGYRLRELTAGAFERVLELKGLPRDQVVTGENGIPIRDELLLEKRLQPD